MKIKEYVEKSVQLGVAIGQQSMDQVAGLVVRPKYPELKYGAPIIVGRRGNVSNSIDYALNMLRAHVERVIGYIIDDCISVVQQQESLSDDSREAVAKAIRDHFEIIVH